MEGQNMSNVGLCDINFSYDDILQYLYPNVLQIFITIIIPTITVIGLVSNILFLFVVTKLPTMRTITNMYLANLAVSDCVVLICGVVQYLYSYYNSPINVGFAFETGIGCALAGIIGYGCYFNSVFIITLVMFDRYMAICHTFYHRKIAGKGRSIKLIASSWILSFLLSLFAAGNNSTLSICLHWEDNESNIYPEKINFCGQPSAWLLLGLYGINIFFIINIILILGKRLPSSASDDKRATNERNQIARMLIINAIIFFLCLGPYQILNFEYAYVYFTVKDLFKKGNIPLILSRIGQVTTLLNSLINPIVYGITNKRYRDAFKNAIWCSKKIEKFGTSNPSILGTNQTRDTNI
ncbi:neuropeptides capa receptor-like [Amphiura filiformis]|uniref:neuropeptides capa receptor-like n=1 Tax=Amphiura filiformis TaxID=82378 RepID=UPI003B218A15